MNGTIEITLEQIKCDIVMNLQCQKCHKFALCVSGHLADILCEQFNKFVNTLKKEKEEP